MLDYGALQIRAPRTRPDTPVGPSAWRADAPTALARRRFAALASCRQRGWTVNDVRDGNPYDATATKNGATLWLEAKGTETAGATVIVSPNEVQRAREHPGACVLDILSDVCLQSDGEVDPTSGTFGIFQWKSDDTTLAPRSFDFTPANEDLLT